MPVTEDCEQALGSLDGTCEEHDDCAVVVRYECVTDGTSRALGIRRDELSRFHELMTACRLPDERSDCPQGEVPPGVGPAPIVTQRDELVDEPAAAYLSVSCIAGRCEPLRTSCGAALCGNGVIDSCSVMDADGGLVFEPTSDPELGVPEPCDGANLGGNTCETLGYGSGTLVCAADSCLLKTSCRTCAPTNERLVACSDPLQDAAGPLALASNGDDVAVVWLDGVLDGVLHFARVGPDLEIGSETTTQLSGSGLRLSLAHYPGGWVTTVTSLTESVVDLHAFGEEGDYRGIAYTIEGADSPWLTERPSGAPLLTYFAEGERRAVILSSDLTPATEPVTLGQSGVNSPVHGVFVGDAFLVALTFSGLEPEVGMRIARVELDGSIASPPPDPFTVYIPFARLSMTDRGPLVVYTELGAGEPIANAYSALLDENGSLASAPVLLGPAIDAGGLERFEGGALLAASVGSTDPEVTLPHRAELLLLDADGSVSSRLPIASHPNGADDIQVVTRASDAVVAWTSLDGPELARVVP